MWLVPHHEHEDPWNASIYPSISVCLPSRLSFYLCVKAGLSAVLTEGYRAFSQSLQANERSESR
jgi:hypothetical protein